MDTKNVALVDVSSFMLFEATGDSEADSELNLAADMDVAAHNAADDDDDDDDAQSCSCDSLEEPERFVEVREFDHHHRRRAKSVVDDGHDEEEEEEDGEVIDWSGGGEEEEEEGDEVAMSSTARDHGQRKKSRACVDHSAMNSRIDEMEKNRLFWEACLAS